MKYIVIDFENQRIMISRQEDEKENLENITKALAAKYYFSVYTDYDSCNSSSDWKIN